MSLIVTPGTCFSVLAIEAFQNDAVRLGVSKVRYVRVTLPFAPADPDEAAEHPAMRASPAARQAASRRLCLMEVSWRMMSLGRREAGGLTPVPTRRDNVIARIT